MNLIPHKILDSELLILTILFERGVFDGTTMQLSAMADLAENDWERHSIKKKVYQMKDKKWLDSLGSGTWTLTAYGHNIATEAVNGRIDIKKSVNAPKKKKLGLPVQAQISNPEPIKKQESVAVGKDIHDATAVMANLFQSR
jgi:hypothetical protein